MTLREFILNEGSCCTTKKWNEGDAAKDFDVDEATSKKVIYRILRHLDSLKRTFKGSNKYEGIAYTYNYLKKLGDSLDTSEPEMESKPIMGQAAKKHDDVCPECGKKFSECECC